MSQKLNYAEILLELQKNTILENLGIAIDSEKQSTLKMAAQDLIGYAYLELSYQKDTFVIHLFAKPIVAYNIPINAESTILYKQLMEVFLETPYMPLTALS